jgi:hypothetical protein
MLAEYIDPVLQSLEDQDAQLEGIQVNINGRLQTITEDQQEAYQELVRQGGMLTELDANQQELIQQMGGTQNLLTSLTDNVSEIRTGLETAREEREAGFALAAEEREAGFTQAEQDRQRLMEAIVEARGLTTALSQEMRNLLAQSNQTMQEMFEGTDINIEELRSGQLSQEEATNALREYTEQTREELRTGLEEASIERQQIAQSLEDKLEQHAQGQTVALSEAESRLLASQIQGDERLIQEFSTRAGALEEYIAAQGTTLSNAQEQIRQQQEQQYQELTEGQRQAAEDRIRIEQSTNDKLEQLREGIAVEFTDAEARRLEQLTGLESRLLQNSAENAEEFARLLENEGQRFDDITAGLSSEILSLQQQAGEFEQQTGERFDEATQERIEMYQGLLGRLDEFRRGAEVDLSETELRVLSEVTGVEERLLQQASEDAEEFNALLADQGVRFEEITDAIRSDIFASEERLTGQIGGLTEDVARVAEDLIRADGRIEEMSAESQQRYNELGLDIEDLSTLVGVNIEALRNDIITQDSALRELFENQGEQLGQDIEDLNTKLEDAREGFSVELSETEANILSEITGLESDFLQSMGELEGGLQDAFGEGFENVQGQVEGIGQQVAGVESRIGEVED